jgi:NADP-dependent 3-hydroxy acid dehydrogenase YdfG/acyl carrier protein
LNQHLDTHREFLGAQLGIARDLADALRRGNLDDGSIRAIEAVSNQSVALSDSHSQAAHVLVGLAELEAGLPSTGTSAPAPARRAVTVRSAPAINAPVAPQVDADPAYTEPAPAAAEEPAVPGSDLSDPAAEPDVTPIVPAVDGVAAAVDDLHTALREVIADKTGYPVDMIGTTMDLESDLGVDSIKRVQVLGAVQERFPQLPSLGPEQLGELRTIDQIVEVISGGSDAYPKAPAAVAPRLSDHNEATSGDSTPTSVLPTTERTPVELVALPPIDRLGDAFATVRTATVVAVGDVDARRIESLTGSLQARGWGLTDPRSDVDDDTASGTSTDLCVVVLGVPTTIAEAQQILTAAILAMKGASHAATRSAASAPHSAGPESRRAVLTVTTVDGALGFGDFDVDPVAAMAAGIGGAVKTLAAERPELFCRAIDMHPLIDPDQFAELIMDEAHDSAVDTFEVGIGELGERHTLVPSRHGDPAAALDAVGHDQLDDMMLDADDVLVVSGGARGVTALCVRELAAHTKARFVLLGRTDPSPDPEWARGVGDEALQGAAIQALAGKGLTPKDISSRCAGVRAGREIRATLAVLGERGQYLTVDVTDTEALHDALAPLRNSVTGIVHGAGVLADSLIASKEESEISRVLTPKLRGFAALMDALDVSAEDSRLRHLVLFTSVAGLFGNRGQSDYATANEALGRFAVATKRRHPERHVTAIDWGAWDAGMVDDALRAHFRDNGVELLHPDVGALAFAEQFSAKRADDVVVLIGPTRPLASGPDPETVAFTAHRGIEDLARHPIIAAHRIGEKVVLPATFALGAMINVVERTMPGRCVRGVRDFRVLGGVSFGPGDTAAELIVHAEPTRDATALSVRVTSVHKDRLTPHYVAQLVLSDNQGPAPTIDRNWNDVGRDAQFIYREGRQFHGPALRGLTELFELSESRLVVTAGLPEIVVALGAFQGVLHNPVLADLILQVPPVLAYTSLGSACLPMGVGSIDFFHPLPTDEAFTIVADNLRHDATSATVDTVAVSKDNTVLQRWNDVSVVTAPDLSEMFLESVRRWN